jgi:hypothetical protein
MKVKTMFFFSVFQNYIFYHITSWQTVFLIASLLSSTLLSSLPGSDTDATQPPASDDKEIDKKIK